MNAIVEPPEADAREVSARLRAGPVDHALQVALADLVDGLDVVDRLARSAGGPLPLDTARHALDVVRWALHEMLRAGAEASR